MSDFSDDDYTNDVDDVDDELEDDIDDINAELYNVLDDIDNNSDESDNSDRSDNSDNEIDDESDDSDESDLSEDEKNIKKNANEFKRNMNNINNFLNENIKIVNTKTYSKETAEIIVNPNDRLTTAHMSLFELTAVIGNRAEQIAKGSQVYINEEEYKNLTDPIEIAKKEILAKRCPLSIMRCVGLNRYEKWDTNEMLIIHKI